MEAKFSDTDHMALDHIKGSLATARSALIGMQSQQSVSSFNKKRLFEAANHIEFAIGKLGNLDDIEAEES